MTKRIATRRLGGVESTKSRATIASAGDARAPVAGAFALIEYEDNGGRKSFS